MPIPLSLATGAAVSIGKTVLSHLAPEAQRALRSAREFESVFLSQVLNTMTSGLGQQTGFDGGHAESQWRTLMNEHLAKRITEKGGLGIADSVAQELLRAQEMRR
jgi:Rod binding domain-containing protein